MAASTTPLPNKPSLARTPKYYEADGALRAYATRANWFAGIATVVALVAVLGMLVMKLQKPTIIRDLPNGQSVVIGSDGSFQSAVSISSLQQLSADQAPTDYDKEYWVRTFLDYYLNYDEHRLAYNWQHAFNMMTGNLRAFYMNKLQQTGIVADYESKHERSDWKLLRIDQTDPLNYTVIGNRVVHYMSGGQTETTEEFMETYKIRLAEVDRTKLNPAGLLVANIQTDQISAQHDQHQINSNSDAEGQ